MNLQHRGLKIAISGGMGSGKTTNSKYILKELDNSIKLSFALPIYKIVNWWEQYHEAILLKESEDYVTFKLMDLLLDMYGELSTAIKVKKSLINLLKEDYKNVNWTFKDDKHRKLMQVIGDVLREERSTIIVDYFIKSSNRHSKRGKNVICDDARFPNEVKAVKDSGFVTIHLDISEEEQEKRIKSSYKEFNLQRLKHSTERALDNFKDFDYIINAELNLDDIYLKLDTIILKHSLTPSDIKWIARGVELSEHISTWSTCLSRRVGAVVMNKDNVVIGTGYNGAPRGSDNSLELGFCTKRVKGEQELGRPVKSGEMNHLCLASHAEQNALSQSSTIADDCTMYVTASPCYECSKAIANAVNVKVSRIVFKGDYPDKRGLKVLRNRGIKIFKFEDLL